MTEPIPPAITPKKNPIIEPPMKTDLQKNNPQEVTQPAQDFLDGYTKANHTELTLDGLKNLTVQAWQILSPETQAEIRRILTERERNQQMLAEERDKIRREREKANAPQAAQDFLDGYKQTYGSLPYVAEIKGGYIKNQAWHNLSEYAKAEVIKMLEKQNTG